MKRLSIFILIIIFLVFPSYSFARSGCCSHHNGVCGCQCCDGTPLSAKCAPYYPQCNGGNNTNQIQEERSIHNPLKSTPILTLTLKPTKIPHKKINKKDYKNKKIKQVNEKK